MGKLLKYSKKYWIQITLAAVSSVTASVSTVMIIDILKLIIDQIAGGTLKQTIHFIVIKMLIVICAGIVSNYMVVAMTGFIGAGLLQNLRNDAVNALMKASPEYINKCNYGDMMERITEDIEGLAGFMSGYFKDCLYVPVITIVYSVYLFLMNPPLAAICLMPLAIIVPINIKLLKPIKLRQHQYARELGQTNNNIEEAFAGAEVVKSYNLQKCMMNRYEKALYKTFVTSDKTDLAQYNLEPLSRAIQEIPLALAICVGGVFVFRNVITIGVLIAYMSIIKKLIDPLSYTYQLVVRFQTALVSVSRVFEIIEIQPEKTDYEEKLQKANVKADEIILAARDQAKEEHEKAEKCVEKGGNLLISFENVSFAYEDENVLHNVSFRVKPDERIAFVGESGSGKSTILKLISRQFATDKIALVSQETTLFPLSVADNVRVGNPQASHDDIVRALGMAGCETFIKQLPEGIETVLTENGGNLSGGQRQRISIARAIVKDAELLLFDEPTSALDYQTEINICKTIDEISKDRTVITVAHRLNTIRDYDRIYVLDRGEIVEQGKHSELMSMHGRYAHMYDEFINKEMRDRV